jgi:lipopolysaccharide export system permease protein
VEASGYDSTAFRVDYFVKWAAPLGCIVLPALALFFAIGGPPFPSSSLTVSLSVIVAVSFVLLTGVGASLGYGGVVTPFIAGWGPPGLFAALALLAGLRLRNLGRH